MFIMANHFPDNFQNDTHASSFPPKKYPDDRDKSNHRGMSPLSMGHHIKFAPPECEQKLYDVTYGKKKALNYTCMYNVVTNI